MLDTITRYINGGISAAKDRHALRMILEPIADRFSSQTLTSGALAGAGVAAPTLGANWYGTVQGALVTKASSTAMATLVGTVTNAKFNVYCFFIDRAGTLTSAMGSESATLLGVGFPPLPVGKAIIGFVIINPTGTGNFVGGTTLFNDGTVVPNAVYVNTVGAFDPTVLI